MKTLLSHIALLLSITSLFGCSISPKITRDVKREREEFYSNVKKVNKDALACYARLSKDTKYEPMYHRFSLKLKLASQSELLDSDRISDEMVMLGLDWYAVHQQCDNAKASGYGRLDTRLELVAIKWLHDRARLFERIVTERPTYGAVNAELDVLKGREVKEFKEWFGRSEIDFSRRQSEQDATILSGRASKAQKDAFAAGAKQIAGFVLEALSDLADVQLELARAQQAFQAANPKPAKIEVQIQPIQPHVTNTRCSVDFRGTLNCTHY